MNRNEYLTMWTAIKVIEDAYYANAIPPHSGYRKAVKKSIKEIKFLIQKEIGQLE